MHVETIETFLIVVEEASLIRAAERLHVSPSTVTSRLHTLESELGQTLVNRHKTGAQPTAAGLRFKRNAETIVGLWRQSKHQAQLPSAVSSVATLGVHTNLWHGLGQVLFEFVRESDPTSAVAVSRGLQSELVRWLDDGLTDLSLTHAPGARAHQTSHALPPELLVLVSTDPTGPIRFDPGYVFVDYTDDFGRRHAEAYAAADVARLSFSSAQLGLEHVLAHGGSTYLPLRMAAEHLASKNLFRLDAPEFDLAAWLVVNNSAAAEWSWLEDVLELLHG